MTPTFRPLVAAHDPCFPAEEIRDDDEFPVPRPERVDDAAGERDGEAEEECPEVVTALDGTYNERRFQRSRGAGSR